MGPLEEFFSKHDWCKQDFAFDKNGNYANPRSEEAVSWCLLGACQKINSNKIADLSLAVLKEREDSSISNFNDEILTSKEQLMEFLKKYNL